jgi:hypothetical protein
MHQPGGTDDGIDWTDLYALGAANTFGLNNNRQRP